MTRSVLIAIATAILAAACGSSDAAPDTRTEQNATSCAPVASPAALPTSAPAVSFASDVLPILVASCGFSSCHGAVRGSNVFLGAKDSANDATAIRALLVDKRSKQSASTPYVTPSNPARSYLYLKLTGDLCGLEDCAGGSCGQTMPRGGDELDAAALETVRTWILQGATDS